MIPKNPDAQPEVEIGQSARDMRTAKSRICLWPSKIKIYFVVRGDNVDGKEEEKRGPSRAEKFPVQNLVWIVLAVQPEVYLHWWYHAVLQRGGQALGPLGAAPRPLGVP